MTKERPPDDSQGCLLELENKLPFWNPNIFTFADQEETTLFTVKPNGSMVLTE
jgi:hypothetical protein